jgi:hypothetical protein
MNSKINRKPIDDGDRASILALNAAHNFLECLRLGRLPGRANSRRALRCIRQAAIQNRRAVALTWAM